MGQIAQNRCYAYVWRLFSTKLNFENETEKIKNRSDGKKRNITWRLFGTYERYS
jgi:hypothetical protein